MRQNHLALRESFWPPAWDLCEMISTKEDANQEATSCRRLHKLSLNQVQYEWQASQRVLLLLLLLKRCLNVAFVSTSSQVDRGNNNNSLLFLLELDEPTGACWPIDAA